MSLATTFTLNDLDEPLAKSAIPLILVTRDGPLATACPKPLLTKPKLV